MIVAPEFVLELLTALHDDLLHAICRLINDNEVTLLDQVVLPIGIDVP